MELGVELRNRCNMIPCVCTSAMAGNKHSSFVANSGQREGECVRVSSLRTIYLCVNVVGAIHMSSEHTECAIIITEVQSKLPPSCALHLYILLYARLLLNSQATCVSFARGSRFTSFICS